MTHEEHIELMSVDDARRAVQRFHLKSNMMAAHSPEEVFDRINMAAEAGRSDAVVSYVPDPMSEDEVYLVMELESKGYSFTREDKGTHTHLYIWWNTTD